MLMQKFSESAQKIERQIENLKKAYPNARLYQEAYTGTKTEGRKEFNKMLSAVKSGDTIIFDSVSRMSRNSYYKYKRELFEQMTQY